MVGQEHNFNMLGWQKRTVCVISLFSLCGLCMEVLLGFVEVAAVCRVCLLWLWHMLWLKSVSPTIANLLIGSLRAVASQNSMTKAGVALVVY